MHVALVISVLSWCSILCFRARAVLAAIVARTFLIRGKVVLRIDKRVYMHPDRPDASSMCELRLFQYSSLGAVECLEHCGQTVVAREIAMDSKHVRKGFGEDACRFGFHERRPADAILDSRTLEEDALRGTEGLAAVENDQAEVCAMRIDGGYE